MTTVKDFKDRAKLPSPIYASKPYVILFDNVVMDAGELSEIVDATSDYYDKCIIDIRRYDLHLNDNTKIEHQDNHVEMTVNQALLESDEQKGYQEAARVLHHHIDALQAELKWAWNEMKITEYPADEDAEYEFCRICQQPEWKHKSDCDGLAHKKMVEQLLKGA